MGGGISVVAFKKGKAVEVNRGAMGYGPFSPQRAGTMALIDVMELCFSGKYTKKDLIKKFMRSLQKFGKNLHLLNKATNKGDTI